MRSSLASTFRGCSNAGAGAVPRKWDLPKACFQGGSPKRHDEAIGQKGQCQVQVAGGASTKGTALLTTGPTSSSRGLTQMRPGSLMDGRWVNFASFQLRTTGGFAKCARPARRSFHTSSQGALRKAAGRYRQCKRTTRQLKTLDEF